VKRIVPVLLLALLSASSASAQDWAKKMFQTTEHDFGTVARGAKAEFAFEFENLYEEDVHVAKVYSSCGCTTPTIEKRDVKTFEKAQILATYNTRAFLGQKSATVTVVFDKPQYAEVQLEVTGYIRSDVVLEPGEVNFGEVDQAQQAETTLQITYAGRADWKIVDVRSANQHLEVDLTETSRTGGRVTYDMLVRLKDDAPPGHFHDELSIITDDARLKSIPVLVHGNVMSPLTVSPAALFLGVLQPGQSVTKQLIVRGKQPFKLLAVRCEDDRFQFKAPDDKAATIHFIPVTFTAPDSTGEVAQAIVIKTDLGTGTTASCMATATVRSTDSSE
jgi:hypothetical protein